MSSNSREGIAAPRQVLVSWLARMYRHGLTTTSGGNLSLLDDDGTLYITPSGGDKAIVPPEKIAVRAKGSLKFSGKPSMEWPLHTVVYKTKASCRAVLHAHSRTLVAFSIAMKKGSSDNAVDPRVPDTRVLLGAYQACGKVALAPYAIPGSQELASVCEKAFLEGADCVILQNHGVVVAGKTMHQAYDRFVSLEYLAQSIVHALALKSPPMPLPESILNYALENVNAGGENSPFPPPIPLASSAEKGQERVITGAEKELRNQLCQFVHRAYHQNLITSSSGSFSARVTSNDDDLLSFLVTPTEVDRLSLEPSDLCLVSQSTRLAGPNRVEAPPTKVPKLVVEDANRLWFYPVQCPDSPQEVHPSRAANLHATIYEKHPDVNFIMVVQPPFATAYCVTGLPFNAAGIPESHVILHNVQSIPLGSVLDDNGAAAADSLDPSSGRNTILVAGYGLVTVGKDLLKTFVQVEVCESMCGVTLTALRRGDVELLSTKQVHDIDEVFCKGH